jgi:hypothetical protein
MKFKTVKRNLMKLYSKPTQLAFIIFRHRFMTVSKESSLEDTSTFPILGILTSSRY